MIIREVSIHDFQLVSLHEQFHNNKLDISYSQFTKFVQNLNNNHHIFVIEIDNKIIASATLIIETKLIHNNGKVAHIEDVIVDKLYRKQNYGNLIVDHLISFSKNNLCYKVILDCNDFNIKFYEKCGFHKKENQMALYF